EKNQLGGPLCCGSEEVYSAIRLCHIQETTCLQAAAERQQQREPRSRQSARLWFPYLTELCWSYGGRNEGGDTVPLSVAVDVNVLLPEYGDIKIELDDAELFIYREHDILAKEGKLLGGRESELLVNQYPRFCADSSSPQTISCFA
ncbi:unnamed protein product, partial [Allacma fusca]